MAIDVVPQWMTGLEEEDVNFIKRFLLASGSLKAVAAEYGVTYPTVRLRLDRLIQKIQMNEDTAEDPFVSLVKRLALKTKWILTRRKSSLPPTKKKRGKSDAFVPSLCGSRLGVGMVFGQPGEPLARPGAAGSEPAALHFGGSGAGQLYAHRR